MSNSSVETVADVGKEDVYWDLWNSGKSYRVESPKHAEFIANRMIHRLYGNRVSPGTISKRPKGNWLIDLKIIYPRLVRNDLEDREIIRFLEFPKIGRMEISSEGKALRYPKRANLSKSAYSNLEIWRNRIESIIVNKTAENLTKIHDIRNGINKFSMILAELYDNRSVPLNTICYEIFHGERNKMHQYLSVMESLDLVSLDEQLVTYGSTLEGIYEKAMEKGPKKAKANFKRLALTEILAHSYSMLKDYLGIHNIDPFVRIETSIYRESMIAKTDMPISESRLMAEYLESSPRSEEITHAYFKRYLDELEDAGTIRQIKEGLYSVVKILLKDMLAYSEELNPRVI